MLDTYTVNEPHVFSIYDNSRWPLPLAHQRRRIIIIIIIIEPPLL